MMFISKDLRGPRGQDKVTVFVSQCQCVLLAFNPLKVVEIQGLIAGVICPDLTRPPAFLGSAPCCSQRRARTTVANEIKMLQKHLKFLLLINYSQKCDNREALWHKMQLLKNTASILDT